MVTGVVAGAVAAAVLLAAGGAGSASGGGGVTRTGGDGTGGGTGAVQVRAEARFAPPSAFIPSPAVTYDMELVPAASWIEVEQRGIGQRNAGQRNAGQHGVGQRGVEGRTTVTLKVRGMEPGHTYGVHVHQKPCGAEPEAAGGHYQHRVDPVQPSKDPAYVNPDNEVWLDFTAGADGSGSAGARHDWGFRPHEAASVVLHDVPGGAGARVACFTVPFATLPEIQRPGT
ncbi:superoxide dismutase family protein [Streptomyces sp. NPDC058284]|uniref:superoxide dismutase family protein n=1 Tax=unclassified Streptomyces TaxID=2593676 RepID=UPI00364DC49E